MSEKIQKAPSQQKNQQKKKTKKISEKEGKNRDESGKQVTLNIFAANADGLQGKQTSLKSEVTESDASIFCIQETKLRRSGRFAIDNFVIFEAIRKNKEKGGTMLGVKDDLKPVLIEEYSETFELIVVEIRIENKEIRIMTGYGPQENWDINEKMPFFTALEKEISKAKMSGKDVIIEMDANSKLGSTYVENDPNEMSANGKILEGIIKRNGLIVANGVQGKSSGVITRRRSTVTNEEQSVIDYVLISEELEQHMKECNVDDRREKVLTKLIKTKHGVKRVESDHNSIITKFDLSVAKKETKKIEIFNFKDEKGLKKFKEMTSKNTLAAIFTPTKALTNKPNCS